MSFLVIGMIKNEYKENMYVLYNAKLKEIKYIEESRVVDILKERPKRICNAELNSIGEIKGTRGSFKKFLNNHGYYTVLDYIVKDGEKFYEAIDNKGKIKIFKEKDIFCIADNNQLVNAKHIKQNDKEYLAGINWNIKEKKSSFDCLILGYMQEFEKDKPFFNNTVGYLVSYLYDYNIKVDWVENIVKNKQKLIAKLSANQYKVIAISTTFMYSIPEISSVVRLVRQYSNSKIIIGGTYIQYLLNYKNIEGLKEINSDYYIQSVKGEKFLLGVINYEKGINKSLENIPSIIYKKNDEYFYNSFCIDNTKVGEHIVHWDLFKKDVGDIVSVRSSVSCPYHCAFCAHRADAGDYEYMSVNRLIEELDMIDKLPQVKLVSFTDNTFNVPLKRFEEILDIMIERKYHFSWESYVRCQFITDEIARKMKESKCVSVRIGVESGSDIMLKYMNKQTNILELKRGIKNLQRYDIHIFSTFIVGFPGETLNTVKETIEFINETKIESYVQPWLNIGNAPVNKDKRWRIQGGLYDWKHDTMDFETAKKLSEKVMKQTELTYNRVKWKND